MKQIDRPDNSKMMPGQCNQARAQAGAEAQTGINAEGVRLVPAAKKEFAAIWI